MVKLEIDTFSGYKIYPSKGKLFVRGDGKIFRFSTSKTESLTHQRKNPRKIAWTVVYRRMHKKGITEEHQRGIVGADLATIIARRNQAPAARSAAREAAIKKAKDAKKDKEAKKAKPAAPRPAGHAPKVSKQQMKGGKGR
ncbi:hypothetical protein AURDEDRAFT_117977 [Auricularia subglabra TFB-10046 SS5]|uniref:Large ribosomal subunit protein eL24-related N-terminal domain-containing protein n=1 Tax=Auricularia subglabra (strain TFB-10046 / SS5) TaxID=717982 RepID=J0CR35_AURST|nr:hypothetical protein AURDEDRAFT_117977 [Auricularia subglabra TFB-10046 SS5]